MEENFTKYLKMLSEKYPSKTDVLIRMTELNARLNLPKGTEHFMSDLHGEADAFLHIRKSLSGVIKNKINRLFSEKLSEEERAELATVIYYPREKLDEIGDKRDKTWYESTVYRIIEILRLVGEKYSIKEFYERIVGKVLGFEATINQMVWGDSSGSDYFKKTATESIVRGGAEKELIFALSEAVKILAVERFHVVGDIFDRGARPDLIIDELMRERVDVVWGNHDVLWMGAAAGSAACIFSVLNTSLTYANLDVLELGYGISLRPLAAFAEETYGKVNADAFMPKGEASFSYGSRDRELIARMNKAAAVIRFKLEGEVILRNPDFLMDDRLLLNSLNKESGFVTVDGRKYKLRDNELPTIDESAPYALTEDEGKLVDYYKAAFGSSRSLREQISFLYRVGAIYRIYNGNLLFHGCVPLCEDGSFMPLSAAGGLSGKELFDFCDSEARRGFFAKDDSNERRRGMDFLWFLGSGRSSPLFGREKMATFERFFLYDGDIKKEPKNAYYRFWNSRETAENILFEFGLFGSGSHIINGHIPQNRGENPIKAGGKLIVIDGGFCSAYHSDTGVAGYTLIYNAEGMRLSAHAPFRGKTDAVKNNGDILSETVIFETKRERIRIRETDLGKEIREEMCNLALLLSEYENGNIAETK